MTSQGIATLKAELRARARRMAIANRGVAADAALRRLCEVLEVARARTVAFYSAIGDEVPVERVAAETLARGGRTAYPVRMSGDLLLAEVDGHHPLRPGRGGIGEPGADAARVAVQDVDAFVVPGLLFDRAGRRLGRGGGHYDRLLARARTDAALIGICYADRVIEELPEEPWDIAMDLVVTDQFALRCAPRKGGADG